MARPARIICVGNRLVPGDDLGPRVHDLLAGSVLPAGIELVDGGLLGLDLLRAVEGTARAVFVDCVEGFAPPGEVVALARREVSDLADGAWGHDAGLPYLFRMLPLVCDGEVPEVTLIGAGHPARTETVAARALEEALRP